MPHDIIDNRQQYLLDRMLEYLPSSERARFAVGYLFLSGLKPFLAETLARPDVVVQSRHDEQVRLYYRYYAETPVRGKYARVVVKVGEADSFVLTAYLTDKVKKGRIIMERKVIRLWYDPEGDYLEALFDQKKGYYRETDDDRVMERVDTDGNVIGFSVLGVSSLKSEPFTVVLDAPAQTSSDTDSQNPYMQS